MPRHVPEAIAAWHRRRPRARSIGRSFEVGDRVVEGVGVDAPPRPPPACRRRPSAGPRHAGSVGEHGGGDGLALRAPALRAARRPGGAGSGGAMAERSAYGSSRSRSWTNSTRPAFPVSRKTRRGSKASIASSTSDSVRSGRTSRRRSISTTAPITAAAPSTCWAFGGRPWSRSRITSRTVSGRSDESAASVARTQPHSLARDRVLLEPLADRLGDEERVAAAEGVDAGDQVVGQLLGPAVEPQRDQLARLALRRAAPASSSRTWRRSRSWAIRASSVRDSPVRAEATITSLGAPAESVGRTAARRPGRRRDAAGGRASSCRPIAGPRSSGRSAGRWRSRGRRPTGRGRCSRPRGRNRPADRPRRGGICAARGRCGAARRGSR